MTFQRRNGDIIVRPFTHDDAPALYATVRSSIASLSPLFPWCHADYALADAQARVAQCIEAWEGRSEFPFGIFSCTDPELLGCAGLNHINRVYRSANLGYWVGERYRCRGIAVSAAALVAAIGFAELGFVRLEIVTLRNNRASQSVAERLGATREAEARNRLIFQGQPAAAVVYSLIPGDLATISADGIETDTLRATGIQTGAS